MVLRSGKDRVFCAGANIRMLAGSTARAQGQLLQVHQRDAQLAWRTRARNSGQKYLCAIRGTAAGGGYELALATDHIMLADDGNSTVSLPELPLLAVLPGTGGLTRVTDKRKVRRDLADAFCTVEEGVQGARAVNGGWSIEIAAEHQVRAGGEGRAPASLRHSPIGRQRPRASRSRRSQRRIDADAVDLFQRAASTSIARTRRATITIQGPDARRRRPPPRPCSEQGAAVLAAAPRARARRCHPASAPQRARHRRAGSSRRRAIRAGAGATTPSSTTNKSNWLAREILHYWKRVLKRVDVTSRSLVALVEPGSCFAGTLAEIVFACDRSFMLVGALQGDNRPPAAITLSALNFGAYPMSNDISRLATRFLGEPESVDRAKAAMGKPLHAVAVVLGGAPACRFQARV